MYESHWGLEWCERNVFGELFLQSISKCLVVLLSVFLRIHVVPFTDVLCILFSEFKCKLVKDKMCKYDVWVIFHPKSKSNYMNMRNNIKLIFRTINGGVIIQQAPCDSHYSNAENNTIITVRSIDFFIYIYIKACFYIN